ncbi:LOW QUALITY PROTEIN: hypothetical protein HID58_054244, partial [Brassica napus]
MKNLRKGKMESRQSSKNSKKTYVFLLLALILLSSIERISSLSVTVSDDECVQEYVLYEGDTVSGNFVVVDHEIFWGSDHPGLDFTLGHCTDVEGNIRDKFAPRSGMYKFCFHNPYSTPETVSFYIHVGHIPNEHDLAKDVLFPFILIINRFCVATSFLLLTDAMFPPFSLEHLDPVNVKMLRMEGLDAVVAEQTNESTRKRVIFYTVGEYIFLAAASGLQVLYIRKLFSKSVAYNR